MRKVILSATTGAVLSTKMQTAGAVTTAAVAGATSVALGYDPIAWAIGGLGGAYICLRRAPVPRAHAIADVGLSIILGGIASPIFYALAAEQYPFLSKAPGQYLTAVCLCFGWPWALSIAQKIITSKFGGG